MAPQPYEDSVPPVLTAIVKYGVPAAIAIWLVYFLTAGIGAEIHTQTELLQAHIAASTSVQRTLEQDERWHATMVDIMRQLCVNSAKTDQVARNACWQAGAH